MLFVATLRYVNLEPNKRNKMFLRFSVNTCLGTRRNFLQDYKTNKIEFKVAVQANSFYLPG